MPHTLTVTPKGSYLHCVVEGENGRETVLAYFAEIREQCRIRDKYRVLVEERLTGPRFSLEELFQVAAQVAAWSWARSGISASRTSRIVNWSTDHPFAASRRRASSAEMRPRERRVRWTRINNGGRAATSALSPGATTRPRRRR